MNTIVYYKGDNIIAYERADRPMAKLEAWREWFLKKKAGDKYTDISIYNGTPHSVRNKNGRIYKLTE